MGKKWDSICLQCGLCCYEKHNSFKKISHDNIASTVSKRYYIDLEDPCAFLDTETSRCTIYRDRFKIYHHCGRMTLFHILFAGYLPESCAYVRKYRWRGRKRR